MQSVDCPEAAFILALWDEERLGNPPKLTQDQRQCLQMDSEAEPMWMLVLNPFIDRAWVTANLRAPIALNEDTRLGLQCIRPEPGLELRHRWMPQPQKTD